MKVLIICTSAHDRSPALANYLFNLYPQHQYKYAGINKYFCSQHNSHYIELKDLKWADLIIYAERVHLDRTTNLFMEEFTHRQIPVLETNNYLVLNCGEYKKDSPLAEDWLTKAEDMIRLNIREFSH